MFHTFVVLLGQDGEDGDDAKDESSDDQVERADGKAITPSQAPKTAAMKAPTLKPNFAHCDGKTRGNTLGPFHQRVQHAKASASKATGK